MATTPNGRRLGPLFRLPLLPTLALTTYGLSFLPSTLRLPLVSLLSRQSGESAVVTNGLVASPGTVLAALSMAGEELADVKELDKKLVTEFGDRCWWYWAKGADDGWVSPTSIDEIASTLDEAGVDKSRRFRCEEGMKHAFVLDKSGCSFREEGQAEMVLTKALRRALDRAGSEVRWVDSERQDGGPMIYRRLWFGHKCTYHTSSVGSASSGSDFSSADADGSSRHCHTTTTYHTLSFYSRLCPKQH